MPVSRRFIQAAGLCFALSSATTLALIFLPYFLPDAPDLDARAHLILNPVYVARRWVALLHPLIVLMGALGVAAVRFREAIGSAIAGFVFFLLWAGTEAVQQALILTALDWTWRPEYLAATSEAERAVLKGYINGFEPLSDGLFLLLLIAFICANVLFMRAVWGASLLQRMVASGFGFASGLGVISMLTSYGGGILPASVMDVLYPMLQPAARLLTGIWLFRLAPKGDLAPPSSAC